MTIEERAAYAVTLRKERKCNCCQAVIVALADQTAIDPQQLWSVGAGFGGGMGNMESVCGALCGAAMIAGAVIADRTAIMKTRAIQETFVSSCGALYCKDLKGRDTGVVLCPCEQCVYNAVIAYGKIMDLI